jgi:phosphoglycolate phosphatase-like HAD superfamily hydrolase
MSHEPLKLLAADPLSTSWHTPDPARKRASRESIEIILFDLCGVLYDESYWRRWLLQLISRMGLHTHYALFYRAWECEFQDAVCQGDIEYWKALERYLHSAGLSHAQIDEVRAAGNGRRRAFEEQIRPFPHVLATLTHLAEQDVRMGICCARPLSQQALASKLQKLGLTRWFCNVSACKGCRDAHSRCAFFQNELARQGISAENAAYVGCRREDLAAAADAGCFTVAFNRDADAVADACIEQFDQLLDVIDCRPHALLAAG